MKALEVSAKTIEEAVAIAASKLGVEKEKLDIEILEQPVKGLFGMIGSKEAKIKAIAKLTQSDKAYEFVETLLKKMNIEANIKITESDETISISLEGKQMGVLIGYRGETLDAIQYLTSMVVNKNSEKHTRVIVDTQDYRLKREQTLVNLAERLAVSVYKTKKDIALEPMNPYERRVIHSALQDNQFVRTYSRGDEPYRRVVVTLRDKRTNSAKI